jgi:hypothetical protein
MLRIEKTDYKGWKDCYLLTNDIVELIAVADIGPRIIRFGFVGGENQFVEMEETLGLTGGEEWRRYGGHRLWHAPEAQPRTYYPDNHPVPARIESDRLILSQDVEQTTGVKKEIEISLDPSKPKVELVHRLHNHNIWPIEIAPWALTVMAAGGKAIVPLPPRGFHSENLLPTSSIAIWPYTNMSDPRWYWGNQFVFLDQDPSKPSPQKVGFYVVDGWVGYLREGVLFLKLFEFDPQVNYPDRNSNFELFTNDQILELETMGGLVTLAPEEHVSQKETWLLKKDIGRIQTETDAVKVVSEIF